MKIVSAHSGLRQHLAMAPMHRGQAVSQFDPFFSQSNVNRAPIVHRAQAAIPLSRTFRFLILPLPVEDKELKEFNKGDGQMFKYNEKLSPSYRDGPIDTFSVPRLPKSLMD